AGEDLPPVGDAGDVVRGADQPLGQVEGAAVIADGAQVVVGDVDGELAQQGQGAEVGAAVGELAVALQRVVETTGPQGGVGDHQKFTGGVVARQRPEAPVPDRQRLLDHRVG